MQPIFMEMFHIEKNCQGTAVQHQDAKQSEPPGSEVQGNTSDAGVSKLPNSESGGGKMRKKRSRKEGGKGRGGQKWSDEERRVAWECHIRSGGRKVAGYAEKVMEMWNGRDLSVRSAASVLGQIKQIEKGGKLSTFVMRDIERRVSNVKLCEEFRKDDVDFQIVRSSVSTSEKEAPAGQGYLNNNDGVKVVLERMDSILENGKLRRLSEEEGIVLERLRSVFHLKHLSEIPSLKGKDNWLVMREVSLVNRLLPNILPSCTDVNAVNKLLYAGSYVVCERLGFMNKKKAKQKFNKPWWQRRLEGSIEQWRKDLGRVNEIKKGVKLKEKILRELERRYQVREKGTTSVTSFMKNKIQVAATKIRNFAKTSMTSRQNKIFQTNQSYLYKELAGQTHQKNEAPNAGEAREFWSDIWNKEVKHNSETTWLKDVEHAWSEIDLQSDVELSLKDVKLGISRMKNWKAPGPDGVRGFWFKKFTSVHPAITKVLEKCLVEGTVPEWMVKGRTVLIQKDPAKGTVASNYRPIACLPLMWKLMTGIFAGKIYDHLEANDLLPEEQKECRKKSRGTKDQLLIDKAVLKEAKKAKRSLSMAWVDYRKAYDLIPHSWLLKILDLTKVAGNIGRLIQNSMSMWETELSCNGKGLCSVEIKRGIFQGDSLSPLLFVMAMIPLTHLLRREVFGYRFKENSSLVNHLFFMDDLKLYGKSEKELRELMNVVNRFSEDI